MTIQQDTNPSFVLRAVKDVSFEERPVPALKDPWDVRVRVAETGICGSDVHYWQRGRIGDFVLESPIVLGHESSGVIEEVGSAVKNLKVGQKVAIEPGVPCRHCDYCRSGSYNLCPDTVFAATPPHDGTLSKYYITQSDYCYPIPAHMDLEEGAMVEPVAVAVQITKVGNVRPNQNIVVFGCGPIGLLCQAVSKAYAARKVIGVDISQSRLDFAKSFSADGVFLPPAKPEGTDDSEWSEQLAKMIKKQFDLGEGPDVVIEATGAQACIQTGVHLTKKGGMYVQAGMGKENVTFPITTACIRDLTIRGSIRYTTGCYPTAVDLVASGKIDVKKLITDRYTFENAEDAFELMEQQYTKLAETIRRKAATHPKDRYLVAVAGIPGSGKTTTAEAVVNALNQPSSFSPRASLLSMDGFHLPRSTLDHLPNREEAYIRRGAPWTFDAVGFVKFMQRLRSWADRASVSDQSSLSSGSLMSSRSLSSAGGTDEDSTIYAPTFDHKLKDPVENGIQITDDISIVIVEGNYLLLDEPVWKEIAQIVDYKVFIDADLQIARGRLARRHVAAGIEETLENGYRRVDANDYLNGMTILEKRIEPDVILQSVENVI
ncbi:hypothetical protein BDV59DRAFT_204717 [Aspergillus ambiguus]|uniref:uncharacterized protein n=1 Tax=Aspergillus ambiguus TaxID=176160 RepID=UPI003CCE5399